MYGTTLPTRGRPVEETLSDQRRGRRRSGDPTFSGLLIAGVKQRVRNRHAPNERITVRLRPTVSNEHLAPNCDARWRVTYCSAVEAASFAGLRAGVSPAVETAAALARHQAGSPCLPAPYATRGTASATRRRARGPFWRGE